MGPAASLRLQELILERDQQRISLERQYQQIMGVSTQSNGFLSDSQYTPFLLYNNPQIPNNNLASLGLGPPSVDELTRSAIALRNAGANIVTFACTTAYAWQDQVSQRAQIPVINLLDVVAKRVKSHGHNKIGLLDVDGTHACGAFHRAFVNRGIHEVVLPKPLEQVSVMKAVADLKFGVKVTDGPLQTLQRICHQLAERDHVTAIVLGCTEIAMVIGSACTSDPSIANDLPKDVEFFDALNVLADEIVMPSQLDEATATKHTKSPLLQSNERQTLRGVPSTGHVTAQ